MKRLIVVLAGLFILCDIALLTYIFWPKPKPVVVQNNQPTVIPTKTPLSAEKLMMLVNEWRVSQGFQPYKESEFLCSAAKTRLSEIKSDWSHNQFSADRFCSDCALGENLAKGFENEQSTLGNWLGSDSHLSNLQRPYTHACIATDQQYAVQIFGYF